MNLVALIKPHLESIQKFPVEFYKELEPLLAVKTLAAGKVIIEEGSRSDCHHFLVSGVVRLFHYNADSHPVTDWIMKGPGFLYQHKFFIALDGTLNVNLEVIEKTVVISISIPYFKMLSGKYSSVGDVCKYLDEAYWRKQNRYTTALKIDTSYARFKEMAGIFDGVHVARYKKQLRSLFNIKRSAYYECIQKWREEGGLG